MSRMVAILNNDQVRMKCCLFAMREAIRHPLGGAETVNDGWGLGFYQNGEVLLQKKPQWGTREVDYFDVAKELKTDAIVGHVRHATTGPSSHENTHPFRFRNWLFAHNGSISQFDAVRARMLEAIPEHLQRNIRGDTDSEHMFHLFLTVLQERGKIDDPNLDVKIVREAVRTTISRVRHWVEQAGGGDSTLNVVATNGRVVVATRLGLPVHVARQIGLRDCLICRNPSAPEKRVTHDLLRFVAVASEMSRVASGWDEVPENHVAAVNRALEVEVEAL